MTKRFSQLSSLTTPADDDIIAITDTSTGITKKMRRDDFFSGLTPAGMIAGYAGSSAPTGWLLCDGATVSRSTYATLFAAIGTTYGAGDGSTTFVLPNLKGRVPVGYTSSDANFNAMGKTGGENTHVLTEAELASHYHSGSTSAPGDHQHASNTSGQTVFTAGSTNTTTDNRAGGFQQITWGNTVTGGGGNHSHTFNTDAHGSGSAHNNLQPYITINYIVKF